MTMATVLHTLRIRKDDGTQPKDLVEDFGAVVLDAPFLEPQEVKDAGSRDWPDEHGTDTYNAPMAFFKAFDADFKIGIRQTDAMNCHSQYRAIVNYLTNGGILHDMYCPWVETGYKGVRYKSSSDFQFVRVDGDSFLTFSMKFEFTRPDVTIASF